MFKITEESVLAYMEKLHKNGATAEVIASGIARKIDDELSKQTYDILDNLSKRRYINKEKIRTAKDSEPDYKKFSFFLT